MIQKKQQVVRGLHPIRGKKYCSGTIVKMNFWGEICIPKIVKYNKSSVCYDCIQFQTLQSLYNVGVADVGFLEICSCSQIQQGTIIAELVRKGSTKCWRARFMLRKLKRIGYKMSMKYVKSLEVLGTKRQLIYVLYMLSLALVLLINRASYNITIW